MAKIDIDKNLCTACGNCLDSCPYGAITLNAAYAVIGDGCTYCGSCVEACPMAAISIEKDNASLTDDLAAYSGLLVFIEQSAGCLKGVSLEILGEARRLAGDKEKVTAVLAGYQVQALAKGLIAYGADEVLLVDDQCVAEYHDLYYTKLLEQAVKEKKPAIVLIGATTYGRSLAPRLAARLHTGLTADCTSLALDRANGLLLQTRPAFGGNLMATITCPVTRPQMATVRPKVMRSLSPDYSRQGHIHKMNLDFCCVNDSLMRIIEIVHTSDAQAALSEADIVVSAGYGMGSKEKVELVYTLANLLGGAVAGSRAVVDAGWLPYSAQVGQTGKTISPKLYIACGISGAIQHLAGIGSAEYVVAINKDSQAPIFQAAHVGIVGDCQEVLAAIIKELKIRLKNK